MKDIRTLHGDDKEVARYIAMAIRNAMEDFHAEHLSDTQMAELNPIIRNAIAVALHALRHYKRHKAAKEFVDFQRLLIPHYWEPPELTEDWYRLVHYTEEAE